MVGEGIGRKELCEEGFKGVGLINILGVGLVFRIWGRVRNKVCVLKFRLEVVFIVNLI